MSLVICGPNLHAQSNQVLDRLPFEVLIDVVWQGKDIQIRKVLSCNMRKRLYPFVWDQDVNRIYHVLPSREVLIFQLPHVCAGLNVPPRTTLTQLPSNFLPITYWVDNAASPNEAEQIVSHLYFTDNPRRRFELRSFKVRIANHLKTESIEADTRLAGLIESPYVNYDAYFAGIFAFVYPRSVWQKFPMLAAELSKLTVSGFLEASVVRRTALPLLNACQSEAQGIGPAERCLTNSLDTRPYVVSGVREGDIWHLRLDDVGVRRYVRFADVDKLDRTGCSFENLQCNIERSNYRFEVNGRVYEYPMKVGPGIFFDLQRQQLIVFSGFLLVKSTFDARGGK